MEVTIISEVEIILTVISGKSVNVKKNIIADPFLSNAAKVLKENSRNDDGRSIDMHNPKFFLKVSSGNQSHAKNVQEKSDGLPEKQVENIKTNKLPDIFQNQENGISLLSEQTIIVEENELFSSNFENDKFRERKFDDGSKRREDQDIDNATLPLDYMDTDKRYINGENSEDIQLSKTLTTKCHDTEESEDSCDGLSQCNDPNTDPNTIPESPTYVNMYVLDEVDKNGHNDLLSRSHQIDQEREINNESRESTSCQNEHKTEVSTINADSIEKTSDQFNCQICDKQFCSKRSLQRHLLTPRHMDKETWGKRKRFKCDICHKDFARNSNLQIHKRIHTGDKPYKCRYCNVRFRQKFTAYKHEKIHTGEKEYTCQVCEKSFRQKGELQWHMKIHTGEKPYKCETCNKGFLRRSNLENHSKLHTNEKSLICEICGKGYNYRHNLVTHMRTHDENKSHICGICGRGFTQKSQLKRHSMVHSGLKPYVCEMCGFQTADQSTLGNHMRRHTGERPFSCDKCSKRFNRHSILKRHQKVHENKPDRRKRKNLIVKRSFSCDICQKTFSQSSKLNRHLRTAKHKNQMTVQNEQLSTNIILLTLPDEYQT